MRNARWLHFASRRDSIACLVAMCAVSVPALGAPVAGFSRTSVQFGFVSQGVASPTAPVFVTNTGDADLTLTSLALSGAQAGDFLVRGTCAPPLTLRPTERCRVDVVMLSSSPRGKAIAATLTVQSNAATPSTDVALIGRVDPALSGPTLLPSPEWVDFPPQPVLSASQGAMLVVTNATNLPLSVQQFTLLGGDADDFRLSSDCNVVRTLTHNQTCTATIVFTPKAAGPRSTEISMQTSYGGVDAFNRYSITGIGASGTAPGTLNIDQQGLTGSWYQAATSGQGIEVEVFNDLGGAGVGYLQGSWFTFDAATSGGADHGRWYTFGGNVQAGTNSASLPLYQNTGGNFDALPVTSATQVGHVTMTFGDCTTAQFDYTFTDGSGRSGSVPLTRLTPNVLCAISGSAAGPSDFGLSGNWFDPAKGGQGLVFEINPVASIVFFAWYTYAIAGQAQGAAGQRWYTGQANYTPGARTIPVTLYETTGGVMNAAMPAPSTIAVGTGTLAFASCTASQLTYAFTAGSNAGQTGRVDLVRVGAVPASCAF